MSPPRLVRTMILATVAILSTLLAGTAASAAADRTPPSTPFIGYAQGFQCLTVILGVNRSTDNVTPSAELTYEAVADGVLIGTMTDKPNSTGAWGVLQLPHPGSNTVTVRAIDAAGNRSAVSNTRVVHGYFTPGCTPWKIGG